MKNKEANTKMGNIHAVALTSHGKHDKEELDQHKKRFREAISEHDLEAQFDL